MGMSNPKNAGAHINMAPGIAPTNSGAAATNGTGFDRMPAGVLQGYQSAAILLNVGAASGTPDSFTAIYKVQDSADNSAWADLSAAVAAEAGVAVAFTTITAAGSAEYDINLAPCRQYVRLVCTVAFVGGTTPALPVSAAWAFGGARNPPV